MFKILSFSILFIFNTIAYSQLQVSKFSKDGNYFVNSYNDNHLLVRNTQDTKGFAINADKYQINDAVFSENSKFLYTCGREGIVRKWDIHGTLLQSYGQTTYSLNTLIFNEESDRIFAGSGLGFLYIWNNTSGELLSSLKISENAISSSFLVGETIYISTFHGEIFSLDVNTLEISILGAFDNLEIYDILPSESKYIVASFRKKVKEDNQVGLTVFNLETKKPSSQQLVFETYRSFSYDANFNKLTSLHLKPYGKRPNQYTFLSSSDYYSLNNGKLEVHQSMIGKQLETDEFHSYYDELLPDLGAHYFSEDLAYIKDMEIYEGFIYHLDTTYYDGLQHAIQFESIDLRTNLKQIIPGIISEQLNSFLNDHKTAEEQIIPLVQNNFQFLNESVISADSQRIAITNESQMIKVFDLKKKRLIANLVTESKIIRLVKHPFAPIIASLQIDGSICLWDFENYQLLAKHQAIDLEKYNKYHKKEYGKYHKDRSPLLFARRFNNSEHDYSLSFDFSEIGDEIRLYCWNEIKDFELFNRLNFLTGQTYLDHNPIYEYAAEDHKNHTLPIDIKGFSNYLSKEELEQFNDSPNGRYSFLEENIKKYKSETKVIADLWRSLGDAFQAEVPAVHASQNGKMMILDYGSRLYGINTKTMGIYVLDLNNLPSKYAGFSDSCMIERSDELYVPRTDYFQNCFFKVRRFIDTSYAITSENKQSNYFKKAIPQINIDEMSGREVLSTEGSADNWLYQYYIEEYFAWNLLTQTIIPISKKEYQGNFIQDEQAQITDDQWEEKEFQIEQEEMALDLLLGPGNWSEFNDEDYVMITESYQRSSNLFRPGYSEKLESINLQDGKYHTTLYLNNSILIRKENKAKYCVIPSQSSTIANQEYLEYQDLFVTTNVNGEICLWDWQKKPSKPSLTFIGSSGELFALTPEFYYMAVTPGASKISFRKNGQSFGFEQFDLKFNRPDIVLNQFEFTDPSLINAYHQAYLKRLKKMNFTEDMLKDDFHLPEIEIKNFESMPTIIDKNSIDLNLHLEDSKYPLDRINIWVNDVAILGTNGISLRDLETQNTNKKVTIPLAKGKNKVQVSVLNQAGAESYKETIEIECTAGKTQPDLYLITIGESKFEQSEYNLTYAAKDAEDMASLFKDSKVYNTIFTKTLVNEQVTKENIAGLSTFLEQADINDQVLVFFAGHGVLSTDLDYYLAAYDMDFNLPEKRGIVYEDLEKLLDGIKPLQKTLIIDACHSGEIDKEEVLLSQNDQVEDGDIQFRAVGNAVKSKLGSQNTMELTKSLFTDLRKGTGATVISSAGGMEFAMESGDWQNGLFTYALLNGIKSGQADLNKDGEIWLYELQKYVGETVTSLSNGKQQPTSRIENQIVDFRVW